MGKRIERAKVFERELRRIETDFRDPKARDREIERLKVEFPNWAEMAPKLDANLSRLINEASGTAPKTTIREAGEIGGFSMRGGSRTVRSRQGRTERVRENGTFGVEALNFEAGNPAISAAQKFIIPVPKMKGEPLVYPEGHYKERPAKEGKQPIIERGGEPILDWEGKAIEGEGIVFFNGADQSFQAVRTNGEEVVIMNEISEAQGQRIADRLGRDPSAWTAAELKEHLLSMGGDMYNSSRKFIADNMNAIETSKTHSGVEAFGLHRRDARDIVQAVYVPGRGEFKGPAATEQEFKNGMVIIRHGGSVRGIQPEIFERTYTNPDGSPISVNSLPVQGPGS